jgi:hypothetical protein
MTTNMRNFLFDLIIEAAAAAGIPEGAVVLNPEDADDITLPVPRIDVRWETQRLNKAGGVVGKFASPAEPERKRTLRRRLYRVRQPITVTLWTNDESTFDTLCESFVRALPRQFADPSGNRVTCSVSSADWRGFTSALVEVLKKWSKVYHIEFSAMLTDDTETPWILDVTPNATYQEAGRE